MTSRGTGSRLAALDDHRIIDLYDLMDRLGMTVHQFVRWASRPRASRRLRQRRRLASRRADHLLAEGRAEAARRLIELIRQNENHELARRACADLLRLAPRHRPPGGAPPTAPGSPGAGAPDCPDRVRTYLASLSGIPDEAEVSAEPARVEPRPAA